MNINRNVVGLISVAAIAFVAGRLDPFQAGTPQAVAQDEPAMSPEMLAMIEAGIPGAHHEHLDPMIGEWEGEVRMWMQPGADPMKAPCTVSRKWILGKRYIQETVEAEMDGETFRGIGYLGFNNIDGQYEFVWMDSTMTAITFETGAFNPKTGVMSTRGDHRDPSTGRVLHSRGEFDLSNPERHAYVGYLVGSEGVEWKAFEGVFEKKE